MKYKMIGHWTTYDIRKMCIQNDFYTWGTEKQYSNMMNYVETHEPTTEAIEHVAKDIINHSSVEDDFSITYVMYIIANEVVKFLFVEQ